MPVADYGVWKGRVIDYTIEHPHDDATSPLPLPALSLYFHDLDVERTGSVTPSQAQESPGERGAHRAAINTTSGDLRDSRLVYWVNDRIDQNPIVDELARLPFGFSSTTDSQGQGHGLGLDYIRNSPFTTTNGRLLPHQIPGQFGDIIDVLEPSIRQAIDSDAEIYIFGSRTDTNTGTGDGDGISMHNIHMNQGNGRKFQTEDGVFQDGGLIFHFADSDEWLGVFLAFASQALHTDDETGHAISGVGWSDILRPDIIEDAVVIREACVCSPTPAPGLGPSGRLGGTVVLSNRTNRTVRLEGWSIRNAAGDVQVLPSDAVLRPRVDRVFELADCVLSHRGDTILLLNEQGLKVDGVCYNSRQGGSHRGPIVFEH
ncbi:hypothetical protein BJX76DRAFT_337253 [Aspergillus varians]